MATFMVNAGKIFVFCSMKLTIEFCSTKLVKLKLNNFYGKKNT